MNTQSGENNETALQVEVDKNSTSTSAALAVLSKNQSETAKDLSIEAKNEAILAKDEIEGYVIPTEATYNPQTIEAMVDMAETLNITGA
jgi:hypothetical protein